MLQEQYPYKIPGLLGIPMFEYAMQINNHDE